jgi:hypothetical protein
VSDQGHARDAVTPDEDIDRTGDLPDGDWNTSKRRVSARRCRHGRISTGRTIPEEVKRPDVEPGARQLVRPRTAVEAVADGEGRGKGGPMNIQGDASLPNRLVSRSPVMEGKREAVHFGRQGQRGLVSVVLQLQEDGRWGGV